ncbi:hypothetical protein M2105_006129 [Paenibacillus sp. PastF-1]|uniref:hypothetical protein n=2 Tax=Paenibacillus TaxID=44249 RepID=UPI002475AF8D|nr:hypothetical protein [Paenibacillus sp. PastM-3]MDF9845059.1 hypothetical protein [Paenibacillus sp. PastF-2]MDF9851630.1 hypothetical protein [Paenibacillus sp. PastM-2]MDF9858214.1 hypothetical protein [Paenibacillus sp. PastF-1]MDH6483506.1 hypothetical protein [Paenibacillus sp. PastH-2]MDH6510918.1 hypothetical protein [Paenibacillus sp. PastM-3]
MMNSRIWRQKSTEVAPLSAEAENPPGSTSFKSKSYSQKPTDSSTKVTEKRLKPTIVRSSRTGKQYKHTSGTTHRTGKRLKRSTRTSCKPGKHRKRSPQTLLRTPKRLKRPAGRSQSAKSYIYRDPRYGFTLKLPRSWKIYTAVERSNRLEDAEYGVFFRFKYKGKLYDDVLSLFVFKMTLKQWHDEGYDDSPYGFLAARGGRIYAYTVPEELPGEFLNKSGDDYDYKKYGREIRLLKRMVNDEVPQIVKTFTLKRQSGR